MLDWNRETERARRRAEVREAWGEMARLALVLVLLALLAGAGLGIVIRVAMWVAGL